MTQPDSRNRSSASTARSSEGPTSSASSPMTKPSSASSALCCSNRIMCMDRPRDARVFFPDRRAQCLRSCIRPRVRGRSAAGHDGLRGSTARQMVELKVRIVLGPWSIPVPPVSPSESVLPQQADPASRQARISLRGCPHSLWPVALSPGDESPDNASVLMRKRGRCHIHRPSAGKSCHRSAESTDHSSSAVDEQSSQIAIPASDPLIAGGDERLLGAAVGCAGSAVAFDWTRLSV